MLKEILPVCLSAIRGHMVLPVSLPLRNNITYVWPGGGTRTKFPLVAVTVWLAATFPLSSTITTATGVARGTDVGVPGVGVTPTGAAPVKAAFASPTRVPVTTVAFAAGLPGVTGVTGVTGATGVSGLTVLVGLPGLPTATVGAPGSTG